MVKSYPNYSMQPTFQPCSLQVQPFRLSLALRLQHTLSSLTEVIHLNPHPALTKGQQTGLGADSFDIGTRQVILLVDELVQIDILVERHLRGV